MASCLKFFNTTLLTLVLALAMSAQELVPRDDLARAVRAQVEQVQNVTDEVTNPGSDLDQLSLDLRSLRRELRTTMDAVDERVSKLEGNYEAITVDVNGVKIDSEETATVVADLTEARLLKQNLVDALDSLEEGLLAIGTERRDRLVDTIAKRQNSGIDPALWRGAGSELSRRWESLTSHSREWASVGHSDGSFTRKVLTILGALALAILFFFPIRSYVTLSIVKILRTREPTPINRTGAMFLRIMGRMIPGVIGGFIVLEALRNTRFLVQAAEPVATATWWALLMILFADGVTSSAFAPRLPAWRAFPFEDKAARRAKFFSMVTMAAIAADLIYASTLYLPEPNAFLQRAGTALTTILILVLFAAGGRGNWGLQEARKDEINETTLKVLSFVRKLMRPLAVIILLLWLVGYQTLANFITTRIILFTVILLGLWLLRDLIQDLLADVDRRYQVANSEPGQERTSLFGFWGGLLADFLLLVLVTPLVLLTLGQSISEVRGIMLDAFDGISVGTMRISLANIMSAILVFVAVIGITRLLQAVLDKRLFAAQSGDQGLRNSFKTLSGYVGFIIAALMAISMAGINLAGLAIVAGALSVGIGFGLQSIVGNFVSGLILLFERPIKIGDWIVTKDGEGFVRKIRIRSTEIETFDNASIIVPNSTLISDSVQNWTLNNMRRRISVDVGVAYKSDPEHVRDLLLDLAKASPKVLSYPAPFVLFKDFGDSSLNFELRIYIGHIDHRFTVQNDLRYAIFKAFRENNIEIPFPQRDINFRNSVVAQMSKPDESGYNDD